MFWNVFRENLLELGPYSMDIMSSDDPIIRLGALKEAPASFGHFSLNQWL